MHPPEAVCCQNTVADAAGLMDAFTSISSCVPERRKGESEDRPGTVEGPVDVTSWVEG